jgi:hypothetical protein
LNSWLSQSLHSGFKRVNRPMGPHWTSIFQMNMTELACFKSQWSENYVVSVTEVILHIIKITGSLNLCKIKLSIRK